MNKFNKLKFEILAEHSWLPWYLKLFARPNEQVEKYIHEGLNCWTQSVLLCEWKGKTYTYKFGRFS